MTKRSVVFRYAGFDVDGATVHAHYELDGRPFVERVDFEGVASLDGAATRSIVELWYLIAGLSYYKTGAAHRIDLGDTPIGDNGRRLLEAAVHQGLAEFSFRNQLPLDDVEITGGTLVVAQSVDLDERAVLIPFGGGIDSVVTATRLRADLDRALFVVSPSSGRFAPLEATAAVLNLPIVRVTRTLDPQLIAGDPTFFHGHVPVTAMVTLLAAVAAVATRRGGVVMSNEHSSSVPNLEWRGSPVNHQWSKSYHAEVLIGAAIDERLGTGLSVASFLRDRSEIWVAQQFSEATSFHQTFRSCNRAFTQSNERRASEWCGECDKCLFINLVLAPFIDRAALREIFHHEPLSDPQREAQLRSLVGLGDQHKPFECVGDPDESAAALERVSQMATWSDVALLRELAAQTSARPFDELLDPKGPSRVPAHWLR